MNGDMLDSNVIIKYLNGDVSAKHLVNSASSIHVSVIVIGELQYGAQKSSNRKSNLTLFADFISGINVILIDENIAVKYGEIKNQLHSKGAAIPENDIWIAASAISKQFRLITFDNHFKYVDGLIVVP